MLHLQLTEIQIKKLNNVIIKANSKILITIILDKKFILII